MIPNALLKNGSKMEIERASVIDNELFFVASYKLTLVDTEQKEYEELEPVFLAVPKTSSTDLSILSTCY